MLKRAFLFPLSLLLLLIFQLYFQAQASDIIYVYDELGRLAAVIDPGGNTAIYKYDAAGNLLSIVRQSSSLPSLIEFTPDAGPAGAVVTIYGTGFSTTPGQNAVTFNGVAAVVTSANANQIVTSVPAGAASGLITVTSPSGAATSSSPFSVMGSGNGAPSISSFSPNIGAPGTPFTINGTNFESIATDNRARINLTASVINSATSGAIAAVVPQGTSGRISLTTPAGTAISSGDFFIPPAPYVAADVLFTGRMNFGESRTVTIGTANKIGLLVFDGTAGGRVSLNIGTRTLTQTRVSICNPDGSVLDTKTFSPSGGGIFYEPKTLPTSGTYSIFVAALSNSTGNLTLTLYSVPPDLTGAITAGGSPVTLTLSPGQNAALTFSGTAGQRVGLKMTGVTIGSSNVSIKNPDGTIIGSTSVGVVETFLETGQLPATDTYTIFVDPSSMYSGSMTLALTDISNQTGAIAPDGVPVVVTTTVPGQNVALTFNGTGGQRVSLRMYGKTFHRCIVYVKNPNGSNLHTQVMTTLPDAFMEPKTLSFTGGYTVLVDPEGEFTGSITLALYDVPADSTGTITLGGQSEVINIAAPGQNATLTFSGTVGQKTSLLLTNWTTIESWNVSIKKPDGSVLVAAPTSGMFIDTQTLSVTGTYTIFMNPLSYYTGSITLTLYDTTEITGAITVGGPAVAVTITKPGQNARLTFNGTSGQQVTVRVTGNAMGNVTVKLLKPDGTQVTALTSSAASFNLSTQTLSVTGAFTVLIDPNLENTGSMNVTVTSP